MKLRLLSISIIFLMIIGSFGAIGSHIENECSCNDSNQNICPSCGHFFTSPFLYSPSQLIICPNCNYHFNAPE